MKREHNFSVHASGDRFQGQLLYSSIWKWLVNCFTSNTYDDEDDDDYDDDG